MPVDSSGGSNNSHNRPNSRLHLQCLHLTAAAGQILCGLATAGCELLFHGLLASSSAAEDSSAGLRGSGLVTGLLLIAAAVVAMTTGHPGASSSSVTLWLGALLCLACLPACLATAIVAIFLAGDAPPSQQPGCGLSVFLPQPSAGSTNATDATLTAVAATAAASDNLAASLTPLHLRWSRLGLLTVLTVAMVTACLLSAVGLRRSVVATVERRRWRHHVKPTLAGVGVAGVELLQA